MKVVKGRLLAAMEYEEHCVCAGLMPHNGALTCLNTGFNVALGVGVSCLTVHVLC